METMSTSARETTISQQSAALAGFRDVRSIGNDLTRQGRLRMDASQTERRLKSAYSTLGEAVFKDLSELRNVNINDGRIVEIIAHIRYYHDELARLQTDLKSAKESD